MKTFKKSFIAMLMLSLLLGILSSNNIYAEEDETMMETDSIEDLNQNSETAMIEGSDDVDTYEYIVTFFVKDGKGGYVDGKDILPDEVVSLLDGVGHQVLPVGEKPKELILSKGYTIGDWEVINYSGCGDKITGNIYTSYFWQKKDEALIDVSNATISGHTFMKYYTGFEITQNIGLILNNRKLVEDVDYKVRYEDNINVGYAYMVVEGIGNYIGILRILLKINPTDISDTELLTLNSYDPRYVKFRLNSEKGSYILKENIDYYLEKYETGGAYEAAKYVGVGNFTGSFEVKMPVDVTKVEFAGLKKEYEYTGKEVRPDFDLYYNDKYLHKGKDYDFYYSNNVNPGTAYIQIVGYGIYEGSFYQEFKIVKNNSITNVSELDIRLENNEYEYTGKNVIPKVIIKDADYQLVENKDYTLSYLNNINTGKAIVTITGKGLYTGTVNKTFVIVGQNIGDASVTGVKTSYVYTGSAIKPSVTVKLNKKTLKNNTDYTITYSNNINAGIATVKIAGKGKYSGEIIKTFEITKNTVTKATISNLKASYTYTGSWIRPDVVVKVNGRTLTYLADYTLSYTNNINKGTAGIIVVGNGNYEGIYGKTYKIVEKSISSCTISIPNASYVYTGSQIKPNITVRDGSKVLVLDTDYTLTYKNNTKVGTATITITGKDNYKGSVNKSFKIVGKSISGASISNYNSYYVYTGSAIKPKVTVTFGSTTLKLNTDYTVSYSENTKVGTATITVTGKGNYSGSKSVNFVITGKSLAGAIISGYNASYNYTGSAITPNVTVKLGSTKLIKNVDYTVTYLNNINAGIATIKVTGKGTYSGTVSATFEIKVINKGTKLASYTLQEVYNSSAAKEDGIALSNCNVYDNYKTQYNYLSNADIQTAENEMITKLNAQRNADGRSSLVLRDLGAQRWADMMAYTGFCEHANIGTDGYFTGYNYRGENIGINYISKISDISINSTNAWNSSKYHYQNRMLSEFRYYDFGVVMCQDGIIWIVERFAR